MSQILRNCVRAAGLRKASVNVTPNMQAQHRLITTSMAQRCANKEAGAPVAKAKPNPLAEGASLRTAYRPNRFEQRMLVWTKKYKSLNEVPAQVTPETMEYCRNKMRIRVANYMAIATVIGCIVMIYSGKKAAHRGEFVAKQNLDWHNQYNTVNGTEAEEKK